MASAIVDSISIDRWRQAIRSETFAHYQYQMGIALARTGQAEAAIASFKRALEQRPDHAGARLRLIGLLESISGGATQAQMLRADGLRLYPHFQEAGTLVVLADDLNIDTAPALADRIMKQAQVHGIPDRLRGPILLGLGQLLTKAKQPHQAEPALALAHQALPDDTGILSLLAGIQLELGRLDTLAASIASWLCLAPRDPDALFYRARLSLLQGDYAAADADLDAAINAGHADIPLLRSFQIRSQLASRAPARAVALYEAMDQAARDHWICQAYAILARLYVKPSNDLAVQADTLLSRSNHHPLAVVVKSLVLQGCGGNWRPLLSTLLKEAPGAFVCTAATVLESRAGDTAAALGHWREALSFNDPYVRFHLSVLGPDVENIGESAGS